jgi:hypothetical protein
VTSTGSSDPHAAGEGADDRNVPRSVGGGGWVDVVVVDEVDVDDVDGDVEFVDAVVDGAELDAPPEPAK